MSTNNTSSQRKQESSDGIPYYTNVNYLDVVENLDYFDIGNGDRGQHARLSFGGHTYAGYRLTLTRADGTDFPALIMPTALSQAIIDRYFPDGNITHDVWPDVWVYYYATPEEISDPLQLRDTLNDALLEAS